MMLTVKYRKILIICLFGFLELVYAGNFSHTICHVKGITPQGKTLDIKGLGRYQSNEIYDIKMLRSNKYAQDIKAITPAGTILPVKAVGINSQNLYMIVGILSGDRLINVKAITEENEHLDVRVLSRDNSSFGDKGNRF